jgi:hypothetical protein
MSNKQLTEEQLLENYNKLLSYTELFPEPRKEKVLELYKEFENQIIVAPCSATNTYHGCYPGGYVVHVLNVIKNCIELYKTYKTCGLRIDNFTKEELVFSAMFHDLGKIGEKDVDALIPNTSEWHIKNQGKIYLKNPAIKHMLHEDRSLYLLQKYGVVVTDNEFISIRTHNGLFVDANRWYWELSNDKTNEFRNNLPIILHQADFMSYRLECEQEGIFKQ